MRVAQAVEKRPEALHLVDRTESSGFVDRDAVDRRECLRALSDEESPRSAVLVVSQDAPGDRLALHSLRDHEGTAESFVCIARADDVRHRDALTTCDPQQLGLDR
jgi:hypothetical protein